MYLVTIDPANNWYSIHSGDRYSQSSYIVHKEIINLYGVGDFEPGSIISLFSVERFDTLQKKYKVFHF